jgi:hypothetical protein
MESDGSYREVLEMLKDSLEICRRLMDGEIDWDTVENLGAVVADLEAAITRVERHRTEGNPLCGN